MLKNKYVTAAVAVLFILVAVYNLKFFYSRNRTSAKPFIPGAVHMNNSPSVPEKQHEILNEDQDTNTWKRDPFGLQAKYDKTGSGGIYLMGIIKRNGKSHALINGAVYTANQRIGNSVIKQIKRESIVMSTDGKLNEIYLDDYKVLKENTK